MREERLNRIQIGNSMKGFFRREVETFHFFVPDPGGLIEVYFLVIILALSSPVLGLFKWYSENRQSNFPVIIYLLSRHFFAPLACEKAF